jgi:hypothetical protein
MKQNIIDRDIERVTRELSEAMNQLQHNVDLKLEGLYGYDEMLDRVGKLERENSVADRSERRQPK